jgi:hypothetical protein
MHHPLPPWNSLSSFAVVGLYVLLVTSSARAGENLERVPIDLEDRVRIIVLVLQPQDEVLNEDLMAIVVRALSANPGSAASSPRNPQSPPGVHFDGDWSPILGVSLSVIGVAAAYLRSTRKRSGAPDSNRSMVWADPGEAKDDIFVEVVGTRLLEESLAPRGSLKFRFRGAEMKLSVDDAFTPIVQKEVRCLLNEIAAKNHRLVTIREQLAAGGLGVTHGSFELEREELTKDIAQLRKALRTIVERACSIEKTSAS